MSAERRTWDITANAVARNNYNQEHHRGLLYDRPIKYNVQIPDVHYPILEYNKASYCLSE